MKTEIFLLRHGETKLNKQKVYFGQLNPFLDVDGEKNISKLSEVFEEHVDIVISSDLIRCYDSSVIFTKKLNIPIFLDKSLRELNFGVFEGLKYKELCSKFPDESNAFFNGDDTYVIPQGESIQMLYSRCKSFFEQLIVKYQGKKILISSHGGPIRAILSYIFIGDNSAYWKFNIPHASISKLIHIDGFTYMEYMGLKSTNFTKD